ncbi:MAG: O-antigen polymerase [Bryobacterales bacterium]|nr:O-antigen polymerase [Bryobacterales bacterium]
MVAEPALTHETVQASSEKTSEEQAPANAIQKVGFATVLVFVFFRFSFAHEFIAAKLNFNTHIIIILGIVCYLCCILSGQMFRAFKDRSTWLWIGFMCCMCLATSVSFWRGGSFPVFSYYLQTVFPVIFVIPALISTRGQIHKAVCAIGLACLTTALLGTLNDDFKTGRMSIDAAGSDIQDPNDYAAHLILMMPALVYLTLRPTRSVVWKIIGVAGLALCFMQILSTGSRGGFVSLASTGLYIVFIGSKRVKLAVLVGVPVLALMIMPFVPKESLTRLGTIFSSSSEGQESEATDSSQARLALLQASWKITLEHPFLGVGPGIFMDYQANSAKGNGERGMWHVTHNAYTQVSSECGIPAVFCYLSALVVTMLSLRKIGKSRDSDMALLARFMSVMIVGFCVCIIFLSLAYNVHILVLSALTVSLKLRIQADGSWPGDEGSPQVLKPQVAVA